jgi:lipoyl-dependent peroxiredoxin subunit D
MIDAITTFDTVIEAKDSTIAKDLRLNFRRIMEESTLTPEEAYPALLAIASSLDYDAMRAFAKSKLQEIGFSADQVREAEECSAIMGMLNTYYRFRYMLGNHDDYQTAGLRMTSLARPALGKEKFEMLAFAVSVLNGCQSCVISHEDALRKAGVVADKIHDLARLAAVVKGLKSLSVLG